MLLAASFAAAAVLAAAAGGSVVPAGAMESSPPALPVPRILERVRRPFEERAVGRSLPELLEALARSLRAGMSVRSAIDHASEMIDGPLGDDLRAMVIRLEHGASLELVLRRWARERHRVKGVRLAGAAIVLAAQTGGSVAGAIDGVADTIRGELALEAEVRSLASQAQASALLVAVLPLGFGLIAGLADPQTLSYMTTTRIGLACLFGGVALDLAGFVWMRRITSRIAV